MTDLYPIHRTLINSGFRQSMELIAKQIPIQVTKVRSGTRVWDWVVPDNWEVNEAYVENTQGERLVDFRNNCLHLAAYSIPFRGTVTRKELLEHLVWSETQPDAIPFSYLYYKPNWKFCITKKDLTLFNDDQYRIVVDVDRRPGEMWLGECFLPGQTDREIVLSTYLCHPCLANDSLSGVVCGVEVFKALSKFKDRRYSYRLLIVPETIGAIAYLATHESWIGRIEGGYLLTCCGDRGAMTYKKSYFGDRLIDRAAIHALKHCRSGKPFHLQEFSPAGSDERQFNAPGVRVPFGSFMKTPYAEYPEYHTSKDNLSVVTQESLLDTAEAVLETLQILDNNAIYRNKYRGEPFLSKHGLHIPFETPQDDGFLNQIITLEADDCHDVLAIADKYGWPFHRVHEFMLRFEKAGLVERVDQNSRIKKGPGRLLLRKKGKGTLWK